MTSVDDMGMWRNKDGRAWRIGGDDQVAWIRENTKASMGITSAIPPVFEAYATVALPVLPNGRGGWVWPIEEPRLVACERHEASVLAVLEEHTPRQPWWLGYLNTTGHRAETVFYDAPMVTLYADWHYVLVEAGPEQARSWRTEGSLWKGVLPDLMFPADRSWLVSMLWDDFWMCTGGPRHLVEALSVHPELQSRAREVTLLTEDLTPPGPITG